MKYLIAIAIALVLTGCQHNPIIKTEFVEVVKPIAIVPPPPEVPNIELLTPKITASTPDGEVAKAYVHDLKALQWLLDQYKSIVENYRKLAANNPQIDPK